LNGPVKLFNLVLGGGGIKGIAYLGVFEAAEQRGYKWVEISGASAGALTGAYAGAGYKFDELRKVLDGFDFEKIEIGDIPKKVPAVARYLDYASQRSSKKFRNVELFLNQRLDTGKKDKKPGPAYPQEIRGNFLKNIITFSREGCLFDGDALEEWVYRTLRNKGVKTFADLKGAPAGKANPMGYRVRMTGVDLNRARILVLPDDISYYGINPDSFEVAKAVRISTSVPFAFKPVELKSRGDGVEKIYNLVDGGVFDSFPSWLIDSASQFQTIGFRLDGGQNKFLGIDTPLGILRALISAVYDTGVPKRHSYNPNNVAKINTAKVPFLDFSLSGEDREYLYKSGKHAAILFFQNLEQRLMDIRRMKPGLFFPFSKRRYF